MSTRAQKRQKRDDSLWEVIVNNDDVCFVHILPKLNQTDVKFLFEVNAETRALIKRSSRKDDLAQAFKVEEMKSISTLEFAWNNMPWGTETPCGWILLDQNYFCQEVARTGKLELLKWAREEKNCEWNEWTSQAAAYAANLEMQKYCVANSCPIDENACAGAAEGGHLECLKYLREVIKAPWDSGTAVLAALGGHLHILEYLVERKYDKYDNLACSLAAKNGDLKCLKFLHETAKAPWDERTAEFAARSGHLDCLKHLHEEVKAPWDEDTAVRAADGGHLHILEYLVARKYDACDMEACRRATINGHIDCLKYLHEVVKAPLDATAIRIAYHNDQPECLQYLLESDCPLPEGWRR
jgi:hypothetical protein